MWIWSCSTGTLLYHNPVRKSVKYYGAVRLRDGKFVYQKEENKFNGESCEKFLKFLRKITAPTLKKIVFLIDNGRYYHAKTHKEWRDACSNKFSLEFLPLYSPELNPIERLWQFTRRIYTHNRYFPTLDELSAAIAPYFVQWKNGNVPIQKLCAIS